MEDHISTQLQLFQPQPTSHYLPRLNYRGRPALLCLRHRSQSSTTHHHISMTTAITPTYHKPSVRGSVCPRASHHIRPEPVSAALSVLELPPTLEFVRPLPDLSSLLDPLVLSTSPAPHNPPALFSSTPAPLTPPHSPAHPDPPWTLEGWPLSFDPMAVPRLFNLLRLLAPCPSDSTLVYHPPGSSADIRACGCTWTKFQV